MTDSALFDPGSIVRARGREWIVLPESDGPDLHLRALGSGSEAPTLIHVPLEREPVEHASFAAPGPEDLGNQQSALLLRDALLLTFRSGAGPFRSFGSINLEPRAYQLVPLMMALRLEVVRLLIADDVGIGKTIEAGLVAKELLQRGDVHRLTVLCPPHLCDQWHEELASKFNIRAEIVRTNTASRLERDLGTESIFEAYPFTVVSLDFIKSPQRRDEFARSCPELVIVDEAHTCSSSGEGSRHLRYELLRDLAADPLRHLILLTATPHSGDEIAFYNLLGLLREEFASLRNVPEGQRTELREELGKHFVQRRRPDIEEWQEERFFPDRETAEAQYSLTGEWGRLFEQVLDYAREMVAAAEDLEARRQRMRWWAALALLRCVSSSPRAALRALRTRLESAVENADQQRGSQAALERRLADQVLDGSDDDFLTQSDEEPAGSLEDSEELKRLIVLARSLEGKDKDPKLASLIRELRSLLEDGFHPVIFCRYVATAEYVAEMLRNEFSDYEVMAVTGSISPEERERAVNDLGDEFEKRILVATDCLSEGINLQEFFTAVVHYDLSWNPTRHEQREGRVDRFKQSAPVVRCLMLYGEDNPVDGAVLRVILRKAEQIRKELGVMVPMPGDDQKVTQAIMQTILFRDGDMSQARQMGLDLDLGDTLDDIDENVERNWQSARELATRNRTIFAQRRLKPADVLPEWEKATQALGSEEDVERFVRSACRRLGAPLEDKPAYCLLPLEHLPAALLDRLAVQELSHLRKVCFTRALRADRVGAEYLHRAHPFVDTLAEYVTETAFSRWNEEVATRAGAIITSAVSRRTVVALMRLRLRLTKTDAAGESRTTLCEEALGVALEGGEIRALDGDEVRRLMGAEPTRNMDRPAQERDLQSALEQLAAVSEALDALAKEHAENLLADHRRVRQASDARGSYRVDAVVPPDLMAVFVLRPAVNL